VAFGSDKNSESIKPVKASNQRFIHFASPFRKNTGCVELFFGKCEWGPIFPQSSPRILGNLPLEFGHFRMLLIRLRDSENRAA
jgi:hypothetical protein